MPTTDQGSFTNQSKQASITQLDSCFHQHFKLALRPKEAVLSFHLPFISKPAPSSSWHWKKRHWFYPGSVPSSDALPRCSTICSGWRQCGYSRLEADDRTTSFNGTSGLKHLQLLRKLWSAWLTYTSRGGKKSNTHSKNIHCHISDHPTAKYSSYYHR